ncbi:testican-2 isoform X1 [Colossoma macropomum]|uniref:testican-2 isoform X1 n=1 Tax=Colossoma macropomum TaxID=42526 RepID=UPI001864C80E|nr:testican-2 isoform X1 [Colossoma macropomum]
MVVVRDMGRLLVPLVMLVGVSMEDDVKSGKDAEKSGNFMEDEQWLSTISQYSRKIKHWNRFRDEVEDDYIRSWDESQGSNENVDTTKDPCQKVKCSRHKTCVAQGYQRAVCVNRKKLEYRLKHPVSGQQENSCKPCPVSSSGPVCGSDGHNYASQCKLQQQACLLGKELSVKCTGPCPCSPTAAPSTETDSKHESCTGQDLADLGDRLRDWFQLLQGNAKQNSTSKPAASSASILDRTLVATCKDSIGWMFSKLDTNSDLYLDQAELAAINLDKYEVCIRPFFNSCDSYRDGKVSTAEWCLCFWREKPPCLAELERIQMQEGAKKKLGTFIPSCDEDGYYRKLQCDQSRGECWCVDQHGGELMGSRIHGNPDCDELAGYSGDFGSAVGWEDEEEKETEDNGEEAEEEEGEVGEVDDGGYIW